MFTIKKVVHKVLLAFIFPTLILLTVTVIDLFKTYRSHQDAVNFSQMLTFSEKTTALIYELQKERGYSSGFLANRQQLFLLELQTQLKVTDEALAQFQQLLVNGAETGLQVPDKVSNGFARLLPELKAHRNKVMQSSLSGARSFQFYSQINKQLIELVFLFFQRERDIGTVRLLDNLLAFIRTQENAGKERALISSLLASKTLDFETVRQIIHYQESQASTIKNIFSAAELSQKKKYREAFPASIDKAVSDIRELTISRFKLITLLSAMAPDSRLAAFELQNRGAASALSRSFLNQQLTKAEQLTSLLTAIRQVTSDNEKLTMAITAAEASLAEFTAFLAPQDSGKAITQAQFFRYHTAMVASFEGLRQALTYDAKQWFKASTSRIDALKKVEALIFNQLGTKAAAYMLETRRTMSLELGFLLIVCLFFAFFFFGVIRRILSNFHELSAGLLKYSDGDFSTRLSVGNKDEFADISQAFNEMAEKTVTYIERISRDKENLDNAVIERTQLLHKKNEEFAYQHWLSDGLTQLTATTISEPSRNSLYQKLISFLAEYLNCQVGLIYQANNDSLSYQAGYALKKGTDFEQPIAFSEGVIGQAAAQQRPVQVSSTEELEFPRIETGFMTVVPRNFLAFPVIKNDKTIAVLALGSVYKMSDNVSAFLDYATVYIATTIEMLSSKEDTILLLGETQQQSRELAEKSKQITEFNEELKAANQHKSEFLASMSHELRTPLNSMLVLSELLAKNDGDHLTEKQVEKAQIIHSAGKDLLRLINDILDVSKIEAGKLDIDRDIIDLHALMQEITITHSYAVKEKQLQLDLDLDAVKKCQVYSDAHRIKQIVHNFFSNAIKFTEKGSIKVSGTIDNRGDKPAAVITVTDTGIGMSKENVNNMFKMFTQADSSISRRFGGTGLGLYISNKLADLLGANIKVESSEGKGSAFSLVLPIEELSDIENQMHSKVEKIPAPAASEPELELVCDQSLFTDEPETLDFQPIPEKQVILAGSNAIDVMGLKKAIKCFELATAIKSNIPEALESLNQNDAFHGAVIDVPSKQEHLSNCLTAVENVTDKPIVLIYPSHIHAEITKFDEQSNIFAFQRPLEQRELLSKLQEMLAS